MYSTQFENFALLISNYYIIQNLNESMNESRNNKFI